MQKFVASLLVCGGLGVVAVAAFAAAAAISDQSVGTIAERAKYVVSPQGVHLAVVTPKGSRVQVVVDGVAGPRFDDIVETSAGYIDPRPHVGADTNFKPWLRGGPVTFSRDGSRYAYLARLGEEWVLMADNKEVLKMRAGGMVGAVTGIAGMAGNTDVRLEFTGEAGKHLLLAKSSVNGYELWVDGKKWPGFYGSGSGGSAESTLDPVVSPDGEHVVYVAQIDREKRALIIDGKDAGYFAERPQFTADSRHLITVATTPKGQAVLVDGKTAFTARQLGRVYVAPVGNRLACVLTHFNKEGTAADGEFLLVDGKPVEATLTKLGGTVSKVVFSPDGKHYAAVCGSTGHMWVVTDGKKGQEYSHVQSDAVATLAPALTYSADASKLAYIATAANGGQFVVINDEESDALQNPWYRFSPDGKRVAYGGMAGQRSVVFLDGKSVPLPPGWMAGEFTFSPDGSRFAFTGAQGGNRGIFLDGKNTELTGDFAFSPDSQHFAVVGIRASDTSTGLYVDGTRVFDVPQNMLQRGFSPDRKHLFWMTREAVNDPKAPPGTYHFAVYADGQVASRFDSLMDARDLSVRNLYGFQAPSLWRLPPAWSVSTTPGQLVLLALTDDTLKRVSVTPAADSNVDTMIAEAKAAPARAAAKAADEKKKADEAKAAKKAKADSDAAEAAAKAKADYDAQLAANAKARAEAQAKAKADYDARVAKQKADYEAALAKRKADYEAALAAKGKK